MNLGKAKSYLNKINRLFTGIEEDEGNVSQIEKDLMLSYVRAFYDSFIFEAEPAAAKHISPKPPVSKTKPFTPPKEEITTTQPKVEPVKQEKTKVVELEVPKQVQPKVEEPKVETPVYVPPTPKVETPKVEVPTYVPPKTKVETPKVEEPKVETPAYIPPKPKVETPKATQPEITPVSFDEFDILFEEERITALSQKLGQGKITNLRTSMGINERFLIQNELFGGNATKFNKALDTLDGFDSFVEAKAYIIKETAVENDWLDENRVKRAQSFIRKIRRRYK